MAQVYAIAGAGEEKILESASGIDLILYWKSLPIRVDREFIFCERWN